MRVFKFLLRFFLILFILFFIAATVYVRMYGKSLLESALNDSLKRNVVLGAVSYHVPFGFQARDVMIAQSDGDEFLNIRRIIAQVSPNALLQSKLTFDSVVLLDPSIVIDAGKKSGEAQELPIPRQGVVVPPVQSDIPEDGNLSSQEVQERAQMQMSIKRLTVRQGRLQYKAGLTQKGFSFDLEDVHLRAENLSFPFEPERSDFQMAARLVKKGNPLSGSSVQASGWVDVVKKDMRAKLEVVEENGNVGLTADAVSKNNDMDVTGEVKMRNLLRGLDEKLANEESAVNDLILNALSSAGVEIGAQFAFKTKMDDFRVGQVSFSGNVVTK